MDFLSELNPEQRKAASHVQGPLLLLAGAGSGKTRVLTYRIAHLVRDHDVSPQSILAVTFTNKAAHEMRERVGRLIGRLAQYVWISTFHSACLRILRRHAECLGFERSFVVFDDTDQLVVVKKILEEMQISDRAFKPQAVLSAIDAAKNDQISPEVYLSQPLDFFQERVAEIYLRYQKELLRNNAMDFGDLINQSIRLLETKPEIKEMYRRNFQYILVDEYQDTNPAQYRFITLLSEGREARERNVFVVGDEDQSIYGWRGADIRIILRFEQDFPGAFVYRLEQNYRSTKIILDAANHLVSQNMQRKGKTLWTDRQGGEKILYATCGDEHAEGSLVVQQIRDYQGEGKIENYFDVAVFYRTNAQSRVLEEELRRAQIPYRIIGGTRFYDRAEVKDVVAYLRVLANPKDNVSLLRIINRPARGLGKTTIDRMVIFSEREGMSIFEALGRAPECSEISSAVQSKLLKFFQEMKNLQDLAQELSVSLLAKKVLEVSGYQKDLENEKTLESQGRLENIRELIAGMEEFEDGFVPPPEMDENSQPTLAAYLDQITLTHATDDLDLTQGSVSLMTIHLAKGLEFPVVFITGLEEGLFPHSRSLNSPEELEEERRLCYVGMTRAKNLLVLINCARRRVYGAEQYNVSSRFCDEIPAKYLERRTLLSSYETSEDWREPSAQHSGESQTIDYETAQESYDDFEDSPRLHVGMQVKHAEFGVGVVKKTEGKAGNVKVVVQFPGVGPKKLLVRLAHLEVLR